MTAESVALHLNMTPHELGIKAGDSFFPQPSMPPDPSIYAPILPHPPPMDMDSPFTLGELELALHATKSNGDPGKDVITHSDFKNLFENAKTALLNKRK